jgi:hypothetical protein
MSTRIHFEQDDSPLDDDTVAGEWMSIQAVKDDEEYESIFDTSSEMMMMLTSWDVMLIFSTRVSLIIDSRWQSLWKWFLVK